MPWRCCCLALGGQLNGPEFFDMSDDQDPDTPAWASHSLHSNLLGKLRPSLDDHGHSPATPTTTGSLVVLDLPDYTHQECALSGTRSSGGHVGLDWRLAAACTGLPAA
eukprot:5075159-Amphidinium_carterae.1